MNSVIRLSIIIIQHIRAILSSLRAAMTLIRCSISAIRCIKAIKNAKNTSKKHHHSVRSLNVKHITNMIITSSTPAQAFDLRIFDICLISNV